MECKPVSTGVNTSSVYMKHVTGATEGWDNSLDVSYLEGPTPIMDNYSKTTIPGHERLKRDARPPESMTTYTIENSGRGLSGTENADLEFTVETSSGENNFENKNIIGVLERHIVPSPSELYDIKHLANTSTTIPIEVENGLSNTLYVEFYAKSDLNFDGIVNMGDFAILANNWARTGITEYNPTTCPGNYADINRDGNIDVDDLAEMCEQWLNVKP